MTTWTDLNEQNMRLMDENAELRRDQVAQAAWAQEGVMVMRGANWSILFRLGQWWADRPWRSKR